MLMTILLTICNIILLCLMILTANVFMPYRGLAKNFPKDVQETLKPRLDEIDRQPKAPRIFGGILIIILFLLFVGVFIFGGVDGVHHDFTYSQYLKLFMIFAVSFIVMVNAVSPMEWAVRIIVTLIPVFLLANEGRYVSALRFLLCYGAALFLLKYYISAESTGVFSALLVGYCGIVAQFMPAMIMAWYVIHTTKIGEFMSAMQKMHIPDGISVSLAVVMRFFPTIKEEYLSINDAMKMRGISFAGGRITKMIEYRLVPLMFSCLNIGEELSAAAVTRGLGAPVRRTSPVQLKLKAADWLMIVIFAASMILFIISKYFR